MTSVAAGYVKRALRSGRRLTRTILRAPLERQATRLAPEATRRASSEIRIPDDDGYSRFEATRLAGCAEVIPPLFDLTQRWKDDPSRHQHEMPINILRTDDLFEHRALLDLALHDEVLGAVTAYMGQVPRLFNLWVWWSPPNQTQAGSQLFHYDRRDNRQAKLFLNLNDVTAETGPLHFLTAKDSRQVDAKVGYTKKRYTDEQVFGAVPREKLMAATGPAGSAYLVDTARCLHYGSRGNSKDRFVLMASFARANSVDPGPGCPVLDSARERLTRELYDSDPVRSFVLEQPT